MIHFQAIRIHFDDFLPISRSNRAGRSHARHITLHIPILGSKSPGARAGITTGELTSRRGPAVTDLHVAGSALDRAETDGTTVRACLIRQLVVRHFCGGTVLVLIAKVLFEPKALGVVKAALRIRDIPGDVATTMNGAHTREIDLSDPLRRRFLPAPSVSVVPKRSDTACCVLWSRAPNHMVRPQFCTTVLQTSPPNCFTIWLIPARTRRSARLLHPRSCRRGP